MLLYTMETVPNPLRVQIFLGEKGIEVPLVRVDLIRGENRKPEFLAKSPRGRIPVLELDDGRMIRESMAICRYFEELFPEPPLFGSDAVDQAEVEMWQRHAELEFFIPFFQTFRNTHEMWAKAGRPQVREWGQVCRKAAEQHMDWFDEELATRPFLAGERFSVADITAYVALAFFGKQIDLKPTSEQKHLSDWFERVGSRPSVRAAQGPLAFSPRTGKS